MKQRILVYTDVGSVDVDDWLAMLILAHAMRENKNKHLYATVVTAHFRTPERARMLKAFFPEQLHDRLEILTGFNPENAFDFCTSNTHFPLGRFGHPFASGDEKSWFPNFGKAMADLIPDTPASFERASVLTDRISKGEDGWNDVTVCLLAPMHDFEYLLNELDAKDYRKLSIYAMGGCQDDGVLGYNWGVCPLSTQHVLFKLREAGHYLMLISSGFVRREECTFSQTHWQTWNKTATTPQQKALMEEWRLSRNGNALSDHKNLCDPLTLYLALNPSECLMYFSEFNFLGDISSPADYDLGYLTLRAQSTISADGPIHEICSHPMCTKASLLAQLNSEWTLL